MKKFLLGSIILLSLSSAYAEDGHVKGLRALGREDGLAVFAGVDLGSSLAKISKFTVKKEINLRESNTIRAGNCYVTSLSDSDENFSVNHDFFLIQKNVQVTRLDFWLQGPILDPRIIQISCNSSYPERLNDKTIKGPEGLESLLGGYFEITE